MDNKLTLDLLIQSVYGVIIATTVAAITAATRDAKSCFFLWDADTDSRIRKFRPPDSDSGPRIRLRL